MTWIWIAHGYRIWPVEVVDQRFCDGWDKFCDVHKLKPGYKVIFTCERRWIFHTIIMDENDVEVQFHWSGPHVKRRQLHPPLGTYAPMFVVHHLVSGKIIMCLSVLFIFQLNLLAKCVYAIVLSVFCLSKSAHFLFTFCHLTRVV